jgi:hypothetical protein
MSKWLRHLSVSSQQKSLWQSNPKTLVTHEVLRFEMENFMLSQSTKERIELLEKQILGHYKKSAAKQEY